MALRLRRPSLRRDIAPFVVTGLLATAALGLVAWALLGELSRRHAGPGPRQLAGQTLALAQGLMACWAGRPLSGSALAAAAGRDLCAMMVDPDQVLMSPLSGALHWADQGDRFIVLVPRVPPPACPWLVKEAGLDLGGVIPDLVQVGDAVVDLGLPVSDVHAVEACGFLLPEEMQVVAVQLVARRPP